jgi:hypothetical protein
MSSIPPEDQKKDDPVGNLAKEYILEQFKQKEIDQGLAMRLTSGEIISKAKVGDYVRKVIAETMTSTD